MLGRQSLLEGNQSLHISWGKLVAKLCPSPPRERHNSDVCQRQHCQRLCKNCLGKMRQTLHCAMPGEQLGLMLF